MRRVLVVTAPLLLMLCAVAGPASATPSPTPSAVGSATPAPTSASPPLCAAAKGLVDAAQPQRALEVLEGAEGASECSSVADAAEAAHRDALTLFRYAASLAERAGDGQPDLWPDVAELAEDIEQIDAEVQTSAWTLETLAEAAAEGAKGNRDPLSRDGVDASTQSWTDLTDGYLKDLAVILAAAAGTALLLLALARLAVTIPYRFANSRRSTRASRRFAELVGVGLLVAASLTVALVLPGAIRERTVSWFPLLMAAALCLGAVVALAYVLSTRLRVSIAVSGETEKAGTTEIVALLRELGASAPQGLEVPRGADITALEGKNILTESTGGWLAPLIKVVQQILGFTPWRVVVDHKTDPDGKVAVETFVVVTRNGRSVDAATIRRQPFGLDGPTVDTCKVAAAFVLKAIADGYHEEDFVGLAGAQEWASIGLQYVATTDKSLTAAHRKRLLTHAVDLDPANLLAQVSLKHEQYRHVTSHLELHAYLRWMRELVGGHPLTPRASRLRHYPDLDLRVRYTALAVAHNHVAALENQTPRCDVDSALEEASWWALSLVARLRDPDARHDGLTPGLDPPAGWEATATSQRAQERLRRRIEIAAAPMIAQAGVWTAQHVDGLRFGSPTAEYNDICWKASSARGNNRPVAHLDEHIARLKRILASDDEITWAKKDPTLQPLHRFDEWRSEYGAKKRSFLDVEPFVTHADGLKKLGVGTVEALARSSLPSYDAAYALSTTPATYEVLRDAAALIDDIDSSKLADHRVEIFVALWAIGVGSLTALEKTPLTVDSVVARILKVLDGLPTTQPDASALECWVQDVKKPAPVAP